MIFDLDSLKKALQLSATENESVNHDDVFIGLSFNEIKRMVSKDESEEISPSE